MRIRDVTPFLLQGNESYGSAPDADEATDQGDYLLLVRVRTDDGLEGWSDVETMGPVAARVITGTGMSAGGFRTLSELLVGRDASDISGRWDDMYIGTAYYGRRGVVMQCISAIDNCLWSIAAQAANVPLNQLFGGAKRTELPAYASTLFRPTPQQNSDAVRRYQEHGFTGIKFGWGGFGIDPHHDVDTLAAIAETLSSDSTLMIDPGWYIEDDGRWRARTDYELHTMLDTLADLEPYWVEDVLPPDRVEEYTRLRHEYPALRFAAGEQQATQWELNPLAEAGGISVLQPDLSRCGGLTSALGVLPIVRDNGLEVVTHSWLTDLLHAYSLHYLAALPWAQWVEFNVAQSTLSRGVVREHLSLTSSGSVRVPDGVGIGVEIDDDFVRSHLQPLT
jgi:L-rhamnonate dehydratase